MVKQELINEEIRFCGYVNKMATFKENEDGLTAIKTLLFGRLYYSALVGRALFNWPFIKHALC